ncbi:MAG: YhgE/Pip domain-containing protein [Microbacterium sp.]|uniref:YhgE/Pip domain-containing protein n=1 Tax=Microbacterium sp. TaxID=51671 RepID=UPI003A8C1CE9
MKNILLVFRDDLKRASRNSLSLIVLFGVAIIPSFFSWFNVLSSWDPFGNVKNLRVAVANADEGFKSSLFPMRINIGTEVISSLRANSDLNWVFVTEDEAIAGTKSGEYYAALVLPADFSREMMTFFVPGSTSTQIDYYTNEKVNALSPEITGEAATEVSTQINESFTKTLDEVGLAVVSSIATSLEDSGAQGAMLRLQSSAKGVATQLRAAEQTSDIFAKLLGSTRSLLSSAASLTTASADAFGSTSGAIKGGADAMQSLESTLATAVDAISRALEASLTSFDNLANQVGGLNTAIDGQLGGAANLISALEGQVDSQISAYQNLRNELQGIADGTDDPTLQDGIELVISRLDAVIDRQVALRDRLGDAVTALNDGVADGDATRDEIIGLINEAKAAVANARDAYNADLRPTLDSMATAAASISSSFHTIGQDLTAAGAQLTGGESAALSALAAAQQTVTTIGADLEEAAVVFDTLAGALGSAAESGDLSEVTQLIGSNVSILATELVTPVKLKTIPVFAVDTFGAQMAPFYTVLGLWIGALLLSVLIRVDVPRDSLRSELNLTRTQEYFGRYGFFAVLALLQSTLLYCGLIWFVGVQPVYPMLLILAGWVMSLVFSIITYTLVLTFGEAGKALGVLLLVVQISSGGGAYPLSVLPQWFQNISPFVPVTHATNAVRSAIAGIYENDYWHSLGWLALFIVAALIVGLLIRLPLIPLNDKIGKALEATKLM